jgi:DNA topoisomerase I
MKLLIVESPNKVSTLQHILGKGWMVAATVGHLTELANDGDGNLGFEISSTDVKCRYVPRGDRGAGVIKKLKDLIAQADQIYLATDPDREGEGIGWHVAQLIGKKKPYKRVTPIPRSRRRR